MRDPRPNQDSRSGARARRCMLLAGDDDGSADAVALWSQQAYVKAANAGANDDLGSKIAISGDTVVVGALNEDGAQTTITNGAAASADNSASSAGGAYVFRFGS